MNVEQRGTKGSVEVALLDEQGIELPGFGFEDSVPITHDAVRARVAWKPPSRLKPRQERPVRIALRIQGGAILYALKFGE